MTKQKYAFFLSNNGLGDNITSISAVNFLQNYYETIYFLCAKNNNDNVVLFFNESVVTIPFDSSKDEVTECKKILNGVSHADIFVSGINKHEIKSRITHPDLLKPIILNVIKHSDPNKTIPIKYHHIYYFYSDIGLNLSIYFNYFDIKSSELSLKYYNGLKDYKIIFMHTKSSKSEINLVDLINTYKNNNEFIIICANKNVYDNTDTKFEIAEKYINIKVAHYIDIIKNAEIIHVIDSCFSCIVYPLFVCNKLKSIDTVIHDR